MRYFNIFIIAGISSVLLDLDHFIILDLKNLPFTLFNLNTMAGRPLHMPILISLFAIFLIEFYKVSKHS